MREVGACARLVPSRSGDGAAPLLVRRNPDGVAADPRLAERARALGGAAERRRHRGVHGGCDAHQVVHARRRRALARIRQELRRGRAAGVASVRAQTPVLDARTAGAGLAPREPRERRDAESARRRGRRVRPRASRRGRFRKKPAARPPERAPRVRAGGGGVRAPQLLLGARLRLCPSGEDRVVEGVARAA